MKRKLKTALLTTLALASIAGAFLIGKSQPNTTHLYPKSTMVTDTEGDKITVVDFNGHYWTFTDTEETWLKGDICSLIMDDNNTEEIYDDIIVKAQYSGFVK